MAHKHYKRHPKVNSLNSVCILFVCACSFFSFLIHPYYISVTEVEYISEKKEIQIACKIFSDDFEEALGLANGRKIKLLESFNSSYTDSIVFQYLKQHLQLYADGKVVQMQWEGKELQGEAVWCYLSASRVSVQSQVNVTNDLLVHYRQDQVNIVHLKSGNRKNSCRLIYPDKKCVLNIR
ncbi:MAG: DUF6702 family protein [Bacteroidota bacterium]